MDITIVKGDIVEQDVDAVVNAANSGLMGGGGVDGAILRAGGPAQRAARQALVDRIGSLPTGQAAATEAGAMRARWVIHVVGPVHSRSEDRTDLLASCYREALRVADELGVGSIAFPAVSAGIYGWPLADAADVAVRTVRATPTAVSDVRFVLFSDDGTRRIPPSSCRVLSTRTRRANSGCALSGPGTGFSWRAARRMRATGAARDSAVGEDPEPLGPDGVDDGGGDVGRRDAAVDAGAQQAEHHRADLVVGGRGRGAEALVPRAVHQVGAHEAGAQAGDADG